MILNNHVHFLVEGKKLLLLKNKTK